MVILLVQYRPVKSTTTARLFVISNRAVILVEWLDFLILSMGNSMETQEGGHLRLDRRQETPY